MSGNPLQDLIDQAALSRTAEIYAQGADHLDKDQWLSILAEDCIIEGPGFVSEGCDACLASIDQLGAMFRGTCHKIHSQVAQVSQDEASGETVCTAEHLLRDEQAILVWTIRYLDRWRREQGVWRFTRRKLIVEGQEVRPVTNVGAGQ